jgi:transposase InsO family protein
VSILDFGTILNVKLDAQWIVTRCEHCRAHNARGKAGSEIRHLPRPEASGEVLGWDLKKVNANKGKAWIMLVGVDFASRKVFAWDMDLDKAKLEHVQSAMMSYAEQNDMFSVGWSDNGGQFKNVIEAAMLEAFGVKARHIPPGHPQSNGLVEGMNRVLDLMHGGDRSRLSSAVIAYNNSPREAGGATCEQLWRALRPMTSGWQHAGVRTITQSLNSVSG